MLDAPMNRRRGGYEGTKLVGCLTLPSVPLRSQVEQGGPVVQLWDIRPGCL
jgi:hypothetical protein